jgi:Fur family peroxide stress response transcriptional regulator
MARSTAHETETHDARFEAACARAGLAATEQRRLIYRALIASHDHPTAEAVFLKVRAEAPRLSLATVYRNLRLFAAAGLVDEVATGSSFARFDANKDPHHHLICRKCGGVTDFYAPKLDHFGIPGSALEGFEIESMKMNCFGLCADCRDDGRKKTKPTERGETRKWHNSKERKPTRT